MSNLPASWPKFKRGDFVRLIDAWDVFPFGIVPKGATGRVVGSNQDNGIMVQLSTDVGFLAEWDNQVHLTGDDAPEYARPCPIESVPDDFWSRFDAREGNWRAFSPSVAALADTGLFRFAHAGGGLAALSRITLDGWRIMVTDDDGGDVPCDASEPCILGVYDETEERGPNGRGQGAQGTLYCANAAEAFALADVMLRVTVAAAKRGDIECDYDSVETMLSDGIAAVFVEKLEEGLDAAEIARFRAGANPHDLCDANAPLLDAWQHVTGREDWSAESDMAVMSEAFATALRCRDAFLRPLPASPGPRAPLPAPTAHAVENVDGAGI